MIIIGERINSSRKKPNEALEKRDAEFIKNEALSQDKAGADFIDVNAGNRVTTELDDIKWLIENIQSATKKPLCIDSPNPSALELGLSMQKSKSILNSVTAERERLKKVLPMVKKYNSYVIGLVMGDGGIADTAEKRYENAKIILNEAGALGIPLSDIFIDSLVVPISTDHNQGKILIETMKKVKTEFPGVRTVMGLSNISYGLPNRPLINRTLLAIAIYEGLDAAILDPMDVNVISALKASMALSGRDEYCMGYISANRAGIL